MVAPKKCKNGSSGAIAVLGIETSCDETGLAIYDSERGLLAHAMHSQAELHAIYGGVVPELASRDHILRILPLLRQLLEKTGTEPKRLGGIAYTAGPGLAGALLTGATVGRSLAYALGIPALGIHHMEGHLLASMLEVPAPAFPFLALLVSGGHTQLVQVAGPGNYLLLGETLDDAAGEVLDKTARLLGLGYPGGAALARLAERGRPDRYAFPRPMTGRPGLDFSFSGLKTCVRRHAEKAGDTPQERADLARGVLEAVIDTLVVKCRRALRQTGLRRLVAGGGVCANRELRARLQDLAAECQTEAYFPRPEFCTDNGAMIAYAGCLRLLTGQREKLEFEVRPRWPLETLPKVGAAPAAD